MPSLPPLVEARLVRMRASGDRREEDEVRQTVTRAFAAEETRDARHLAPPRQLHRRGAPPSSQAPSSSLSSSWNGSGAKNWISELIQGPHFISDLLDGGPDDDLPPLAEGLGSTWPPVNGRQTAAERAYGSGGVDWLDSLRRVGVLSVLELERQMGLSPASIVFNRSLGSFGSLSAISDQFEDEEDDLGAALELTTAAHGQSTARAAAADLADEFDGLELRELPDRRAANSHLLAAGLHEPFDIVGEEDVDPDGHPSPASAAAAAPPRAQPLAAAAPPPPPVPVDQALAGGVIPLLPCDAILFEQVFNTHPFAAAAFLRAFIACSFSLMLFHVHSLLTWPVDEAMGPSDGGTWLSLGRLSRYWLVAQLSCLALQIPLRMEVQRSLFRVSTARDTADATRRLRMVFSSAAWRANRRFGRLTLGLMLCGLPLLAWGGLLWRAGAGPWGAGHDVADLAPSQLQLASVNASNLLVSLMRTALVVSLCYFVQVAVPTHVSEARRGGLSEGTIRRLRRITFKGDDTTETVLTQCAVCLEHYDDGDHLMVSKRNHIAPDFFAGFYPGVSIGPHRVLLPF